MKITSILAGISVAVALVLSIVAVNKPAIETTQYVGGASSSEFTSDNVAFNGITYGFRKTALTTATTTVCAVRAPAYATSTLVTGSAKFFVSSTTASIVTVAKAASAFATTTLINRVSVAANAQVTVTAASTTLSLLEQTNRTFAPGEYLVVGMEGGTGTFSPVGTCVAEFQVAQ